jgi:transposase
MAHVAEHLSVSGLQEGYRTSKDAVSARHYHAIWLLAQGHTIGETAALTSFAPRWIEELLARYNALGPLALGDLRRGNGAKLKLLTPELLKRLRVRLQSPPDDGGVWISRKVAVSMAAELGLASVATQRGWEALQAIGWSIQKPRPRHAKAATPEAQEVFKKTSPRRWRRSKSNIPAQ